MNAIMHANHRKALDQELGNVWVEYWISRRFSVPVRFWMWVSAIRSGSDPVSV